MLQEADGDSHNEQAVLTGEDQSLISTVAELLGVETEKLSQVALVRQINISGNVTEIPLKLQEARENRYHSTEQLRGGPGGLTQLGQAVQIRLGKLSER